MSAAPWEAPAKVGANAPPATGSRDHEDTMYLPSAGIFKRLRDTQKSTSGSNTSVEPTIQGPPASRAVRRAELSDGGVDVADRLQASYMAAHNYPPDAALSTGSFGGSLKEVNGGESGPLGRSNGSLSYDAPPIAPWLSQQFQTGTGGNTRQMGNAKSDDALGTLPRPQAAPHKDLMNSSHPRFHTIQSGYSVKPRAVKAFVAGRNAEKAAKWDNLTRPTLAQYRANAMRSSRARGRTRSNSISSMGSSMSLKSAQSARSAASYRSTTSSMSRVSAASAPSFLNSGLRDDEDEAGMSRRVEKWEKKNAAYLAKLSAHRSNGGGTRRLSMSASQVVDARDTGRASSTDPVPGSSDGNWFTLHSYLTAMAGKDDLDRSMPLTDHTVTNPKRSSRMRARKPLDKIMPGSGSGSRRSSSMGATNRRKAPRPGTFAASRRVAIRDTDDGAAGTTAPYLGHGDWDARVKVLAAQRRAEYAELASTLRERDEAQRSRRDYEFAERSFFEPPARPLRMVWGPPGTTLMEEKAAAAKAEAKQSYGEFLEKEMATRRALDEYIAVAAATADPNAKKPPLLACGQGTMTEAERAALRADRKAVEDTWRAANPITEKTMPPELPESESFTAVLGEEGLAHATAVAGQVKAEASKYREALDAAPSRARAHYETLLKRKGDKNPFEANIKAGEEAERKRRAMSKEEYEVHKQSIPERRLGDPSKEYPSYYETIAEGVKKRAEESRLTRSLTDAETKALLDSKPRPTEAYLVRAAEPGEEKEWVDGQQSAAQKEAAAERHAEYNAWKATLKERQLGAPPRESAMLEVFETETREERWRALEEAVKEDRRAIGSTLRNKESLRVRQVRKSGEPRYAALTEGPIGVHERARAEQLKEEKAQLASTYGEYLATLKEKRVVEPSEDPEVAFYANLGHEADATMTRAKEADREAAAEVASRPRRRPQHGLPDAWEDLPFGSGEREQKERFSGLNQDIRGEVAEYTAAHRSPKNWGSLAQEGSLASLDDGRARMEEAQYRRLLRLKARQDFREHLALKEGELEQLRGKGTRRRLSTDPALVLSKPSEADETVLNTTVAKPRITPRLTNPTRAPPAELVDALVAEELRASQRRFATM